MKKEWFTSKDLIDIGFYPSAHNRNDRYPTYLELGRIKVFYMPFDHWQILPPDVDFDTAEAMDKRKRIYTLDGLITLIYEWYKPSDYEHLNLPKINWLI